MDSGRLVQMMLLFFRSAELAKESQEQQPEHVERGQAGAQNAQCPQ